MNFLARRIPISHYDRVVVHAKKRLISEISAHAASVPHTMKNDDLPFNLAVLLPILFGIVIPLWIYTNNNSHLFWSSAALSLSTVFIWLMFLWPDRWKIFLMPSIVSFIAFLTIMAENTA